MTESVWQTLKNYLEAERQRVYDEIANYPPPIPRCDVQFNTLLEERASLDHELNRLEVLSRESVARTDSMQLLDEFIASSNVINEDVKQKLRSSLANISESGAQHLQPMTSV